MELSYDLESWNHGDNWGFPMTSELSIGSDIVRI